MLQSINGQIILDGDTKLFYLLVSGFRITQRAIPFDSILNTTRGWRDCNKVGSGMLSGRNNLDFDKSGGASKQRKSSRGQSTVEFALLLPILILIVIGATDLGRAYHVTITLANAAREGARQGVRDPRIGFEADIVAATIQEAENSGVTLTALDITLSCGESGPTNTSHLDPICEHLTPLRVTACNDFMLILEFIFSNPIHICRYAEMMIP